MVGFNRRFDPDFLALKAAIDEGRIGDGGDGDDHLTRSGPAAGTSTSSGPAAFSAT